MPILVNCSCGKRITVPDSKAGQAILCPACRQPVQTSVAGRRVAVADRSKQAKVAIAWGPIIKIGAVLAVVGFIALVYIGPYKMQGEFSAMNKQMRLEIEDVLVRGLSYETRSGMFQHKDAISHYTPSLQDLIIIAPMLWELSIPEEVDFRGSSSEGDFEGVFNTRTRQITIDADIGKMSIPGVGAVQKGGPKTKIAGSVVNGQPVVTVNGVKVPAK